MSVFNNMDEDQRMSQPGLNFGSSASGEDISNEAHASGVPGIKFDYTPPEQERSSGLLSGTKLLDLRMIGKEKKAVDKLAQDAASMALDQHTGETTADRTTADAARTMGGTAPDIDPKLRTEDAQEAELPDFGSRLDTPESIAQKEKDYQERSQQPEGAVQHGLYLAQEGARGLATSADMAAIAVDSAPLLGYAKHQVGKWFGAIPEDEKYGIKFGSITEAYEEEALPTVYHSLGYEIDEVKPIDALQRAYGFTAENAGVSAGLKVIQYGIKGALGLGVKLLDEFTTGEVTASVTGGATGGAFWATRDTEDSREQAGYLGNFAGSLLPALRYASFAYWSKRGIDKITNRSGTIDDLSDTLINQDIAKLVPVEDIPEIRKRMELFRELQETELGKDFTPTWSSLIQTPRMRQVQAWTDTQFAEKAEAIYKRNNDIVKALAEKHGLDPKGSHYKAITEGMNMVAAQGEEVSRAYMREIADIQEEISKLGATASTTDPLKQGLQYRHQLKILEKKFSQHIDSMYAKVDPDDKIRIPLTRLDEEIKAAYEATKKASPTNSIKYQTDPMANLLEDLDAIAERLDPKTYPDAKNPRAKFTNMIEQRKELDRIATLAAKAPGGSQAYLLASNMARGLNKILDEAMVEAGPEVAGAYAAARNSYRTLYKPFFDSKDSIITAQLATHSPKGRDYKVDADKLLDQVWPKDNRTEFNAAKINKMIEEASGIVDDKALIPAREILNVKVQEHALDTLNQAITAGDDPVKAFQKWKTNNQVNLKNFPHVQQKVDEIGQEISFKATGMKEAREAEKLVNQNIIKKYTDRDVESFMDEVPRMTVKQARDELMTIFKGVAAKDPNLGMSPATQKAMEKHMLLGGNINRFMTKLEKVDPQAFSRLQKYHKAVSGELIAEIVRKGIRNDGNPGLSSNFFNQISNGNHPGYKIDTLKEVLTPQDYALFQNFQKIANATQDTFTPAGKIDINYLAKLEEELGISFSSVSSRIYAQQLGKVGPVYIITDTGMKLLKASHGRNLENTLGKVLYDMDALEVAIEQRLRLASGAEKELIAEELSKMQVMKGNMKAYAKTAATKGFEFTLNGFLDMVADPKTMPRIERLSRYIRELEKEDKPANGMEHYYKSMTGERQFLRTAPTEEMWEEYRKNRVQPSIETDEEESNMGPSITEDAQSLEEAMNIRDASSAVNTAFEQAGVPKETGLIFAMIESTLDPSATPGINPKTGEPYSSAGGLFQFLDTTWEETVTKYGEQYGITLENADKFNPYQNSVMGAEFLKSNSNILERAGFESTPENLYIAHFLGASGAKRFLRALRDNPHAPATAGATKNQIDSNPWVFRERVNGKWGRVKTMIEVQEAVQEKIDRARSDIQSYLEEPSAEGTSAAEA